MAVPSVSPCRDSSASPGSSGRTAGVLCQRNITWKRGPCAMLRAGCTRSTTCSKGMSWFCCASSDRARTRASSSAVVGEPDRSRRSGSVLTKKPISRSISHRPRLAVGVPTTTSSWPERRPSVAAHPARTVMNSVAPWRTPRARSPAVSASSSSTATQPPPWSCSGGRAWSAGSSRSSGAPESVSLQYSACFRSSSPETSRRCHAA